jgi:hypothetical protein
MTEHTELLIIGVITALIMLYVGWTILELLVLIIINLPNYRLKRKSIEERHLKSPPPAGPWGQPK